MLKIEQINQFLGFGEDEGLGEYYFSQGLRSKGKGIEFGWSITEHCRSSTVASLDLVNWFTEREESNNPFIYSVDDGGDIFKTQDLFHTWSLQHTPSTSSHGNGLIVDHSGSQRLLYPQDEYLGAYDGTVWYDTWKDFGTSQNIPRDSDIYEDWVVFCNGNKIALLNITDDSWNASAFTMPDKFVAKAVKAGKTGILIGANFNNRGVLILWDGVSDRSTVPWIHTAGEIRGIAKYNGNWIVSTGREYLVTNGYDILRKYTTPDLLNVVNNFGPAYPSGMMIEDNYLFVANNQAGVNREKRGVYILDLISGLWEFSPLSTFNTYSNSGARATFVSSNRIKYVSYKDSFLSPPQEYIGEVVDSADSTYFISSQIGGGSKKKKAEAILVQLGHTMRRYDVYDNPDWTIKAKLYNFSRSLWAYGQASSTSTSALDIPVDGTISGYNKAEAGDEITILEGTNAGLIRHIGSIVREGQANEIWTLDKALNSAITINTLVNICPFKKVGEKTITASDIKDDRLFIPIKNSLIGRRFLVKLVIEATYMSPRIENLWLVYNELDYH